MQKSLMALTTIPKSIIVGADNQFNGHVSNYTHNQKLQNKNMLCVYFNPNGLFF